MAHDDDQQLDDGSEDDRQVTLSRKQLKALERRAEAGDKAVTEAKATARRLAFVEAGVDPKAPSFKYFIAGYDGEETPDAIRKAAEEAGFLSKEGEAKPEGNGKPADAPPEPTPQDLADSAAFNALSQATITPDTSGVNHREAMEKAAAKAISEGLNPSDAIAAYMMAHGLAVAGDEQ
jgi:hypothetical protein